MKKNKIRGIQEKYFSFHQIMEGINGWICVMHDVMSFCWVALNLEVKQKKAAKQRQNNFYG